MRLPPSNYNGLTIVLSNQSRFDHRCGSLLVGNAGDWFLKTCLPNAKIDHRRCDIVTLDDFRAYLPRTRSVLALGVKAQNQLFGTDTTLGEQRGSPVRIADGIVGVSSFPPQDCFDRKGEWEENFHEGLEGESEKDESALDEKSHHGRTKRTNFKFWLQHDVKKVSKFLDEEWLEDKPEIVITEDWGILRRLTGTIFLDIETAYEIDQSMRCFAVSEEQGPVYVFPLMNYLDLVNENWARILIELLALIRRAPRVVTHNGACFDHLVMTWRYGLPFWNRNIYDTLIAQQRIFPDLEKSLGHCISYWLDASYHKNTGIYAPRNSWQDSLLYHYCGMDVAQMRGVYFAQRERIEQDPGLRNSIDVAMAGANSYFEPTLTGLLIDDLERIKLQGLLDQKCNLFSRIAELLIGEDLKAHLVKGKKAKGILGSSAQLVRYFHDYKGIKPVSFSDKNRPQLGKTNIYKLEERGVDDPILKMVINYRIAAKARGDLEIKPWFWNWDLWTKNQPLENTHE